MLRSINHLSLHRINSTKLNVVSDVAEGVLPVIQAEESVIQKYAQYAAYGENTLSTAFTTGWPHRRITLFVLEDLQPLLRQLRQGARPAFAWQNLSIADVTALSERPVVNVYDLADLSTCNIFVNRREMMTQHYCHEHAHPLAENELTRASRQIHFQVLDGQDASPQPCAETGTTSETEIRMSKINQVLALLGQKLSLLAPREILANEKAIQSSFCEDILYLNQCNMDHAGASIAGRITLIQQLQQEVNQGVLSEKESELFLFVGDLNGFLPLALEIAPFYRAGKPEEARALEQILETSVFPFLDPQAVKCYTELRDHYIALPAQLASSIGNQSLLKMVAWSNTVLQILCKALMEKNHILHYEMKLSER